MEEIFRIEICVDFELMSFDDGNFGEDLSELNESEEEEYFLYVDGYWFLMFVYILGIDWSVIVIILGLSLFVDVIS